MSEKKLPADNKRIKDLINILCDGSELLFSKEIGISQPRINRLFNIDPRNGKYPLPSYEIVQAIINKFIDISPLWLLTGKGQMLINNKKEDSNLENKINVYLESDETHTKSIAEGGVIYEKEVTNSHIETQEDIEVLKKIIESQIRQLAIAQEHISILLKILSNITLKQSSTNLIDLISGDDYKKEGEKTDNPVSTVTLK